METRREFFATHFPRFADLAEDHDYALYDAHVVSTHYVAQVRQAAADAWSIYRKISPVLRTLPDETLLDMGIPSNALNCVRIGYEGVAETVVGRFDFIVTPDGPKMIELNAETPFFYWESNAIAGAIARNFGYADPNEGAEEHLKAAMAAAVAACWRGGRIVVTAHTGALDDDCTGTYAARILGEALGRPVDFSPLKDLFVIPGDGLFDTKGYIEILYRFYPLELFSTDEGGTDFLQLVADDRVRILNPPCSLLLQNKCTQVLIWGLYEANEFFDEREREIIERVFLPTYAELPDDDVQYVRKPVFGRQGNTVAFVDRYGENVASEHHDYAKQPMIYQRRVQIPLVEYDHPLDGPSSGHAITTCFIVDGTPTSVCMRIGTEITDEWAHFMPLAYARNGGDR